MSAPPYLGEEEWVRIQDHRRRYLESGGRDGHIIDGLETLLLSTTGRRTGLQRTTPLIYGRDGDRLLVAASLHGSPQPPQWYLNLAADPQVIVQVRSDRFPAVASTADAQERARLWPIMTAVYPTYARYDARSPREIPVVILERADGR